MRKSTLSQSGERRLKSVNMETTFSQSGERRLDSNDIGAWTSARTRSSSSAGWKKLRSQSDRNWKKCWKDTGDPTDNIIRTRRQDPPRSLSPKNQSEEHLEARRDNQLLALIALCDAVSAPSRQGSVCDAHNSLVVHHWMPISQKYRDFKETLTSDIQISNAGFRNLNRLRYNASFGPSPQYFEQKI